LIILTASCEIKTIGKYGSLLIRKKMVPCIKVHGSQKIKEIHDEFTIIELNLIPNYELESQVLSFGENITILESKEIRCRFHERIDIMYKNYKR